MNIFGGKFKVSIFGESHGSAIGVILDGVKPGIALQETDFLADLLRRKPGASGTTPRAEADEPRIISGVFQGITTGAPVTVIFKNEDTRPKDYNVFREHPRPSHADRVSCLKFGNFNDIRGGGHFSGRLTLGLVAAGVVAKKIIPENITISAKSIEIGGCTDEAAFPHLIEQALEKGDSVGGIVECRIRNVPAGLGDPFFDSFESVLSHLIFAVPGIKGIEFGSGFAGARSVGSEQNDVIVSHDGRTSTNNSGGINGGITNGNDVVFRVAVKPASSIAKEQHTYNFSQNKIAPLTIKGRHDACISLRMPVIVEAVAAVTIAQFV